MLLSNDQNCQFDFLYFCGFLLTQRFDVISKTQLTINALLSANRWILVCAANSFIDEKYKFICIEGNARTHIWTNQTKNRLRKCIVDEIYSFVFGMMACFPFFFAGWEREWRRQCLSSIFEGIKRPIVWEKSIHGHKWHALLLPRAKHYWWCFKVFVATIFQFHGNSIAERKRCRYTCGYQ